MRPLTEEEAQTKICHVSIPTGNPKFCCGKTCMAWSVYGDEFEYVDAGKPIQLDLENREEFTFDRQIKYENGQSVDIYRRDMSKYGYCGAK